MWLFRLPDVDKLKANKNILGLIKALDHNDKLVRQNAAAALGDIEDVEDVQSLMVAVKSLVVALEDEVSSVRMAAKEALDKFNWSPQTTREQALYAFASGNTTDNILEDLMPKVYINYGRYDWFGSRGFTIPDKTKVIDEDDADYTINLIWTKAVVGRYTGGQKAIQESCAVVISDCNSGKTVTSKLFTSPPPRVIYGNATGGLGGPSFSDINEYIVEWYDNIDDPLTSGNWRVGLVRVSFGLIGCLLVIMPLLTIQYSKSLLDVIIWMAVGGVILALSIFLGRTKKNTHKILNYRKEAKRPVNPVDEKHRA